MPEVYRVTRYRLLTVKDNFAALRFDQAQQRPPVVDLPLPDSPTSDSVSPGQDQN